MSGWRPYVKLAVLANLEFLAAHSGASAQIDTSASLAANTADVAPDPKRDAATELPAADDGSDAQSPEAHQPRPWAQGISETEQDIARALFAQGNQLLNDGLFSQATRSYRDALRHWDHPGIHYNYALALFTLDQPLETRSQLIAASEFGPAPLGEERFRNVQRYRLLVERQLASIDLRCDAPGAVVSLDGKSLFVAPGHYEGMVLPGAHTVLASKPRYLDDERHLTLLPGKPGAAVLELYTAAELTRTRRLWPGWVPPMITAASAALTLAGGVLSIVASKRFDSYDAAVQQTCGTAGCPAEAPSVRELERRRDRAETLDMTGKLMLAVGGATLLSGLVLMYLNRSEEYRIEPLRREPKLTPSLSISPLVNFSTRGVVARGAF
jgi:hypothetical protein